MNDINKESHSTSLSRKLGLTGLIATGICSMLGASINVVPFMIQRNVPGIGPYVLPAFLTASIPCILAALAYASLSSAMPRAGGSYIYISRGLNPYLGFVGSFSQWFGLSIVIGVISYIIIPFIRDIAIALDWQQTAEFLEIGFVRVSLALLLLWLFVYVNIRGVEVYESTLIPLMIIMFGLGALMIFSGYYFNVQDFSEAIKERGMELPQTNTNTGFSLTTFLSAAAILFSSFIGFDSIAQAGGEAKNPSRNLPLAIGLTILIVGGFYMLFTSAVYHTVPWEFVAQQAMEKDITAPGLLSYLLPSGIAVAIVAGAAIALINDLPAMLLSVSRLMFAWAEDGIFPDYLSKVHKKFQTPHIALYSSGIVASIGILGSHFAGDFFLGIDIMVTSMMVNFLLMCISLFAISGVNPSISKNITFLKNLTIQKMVGGVGAIVLLIFLVIHSYKDFSKEVGAWYFHSSLIWIIVMGIGSFIFLYKMTHLKREGKDIKKLFSTLPKS